MLQRDLFWLLRNAGWLVHTTGHGWYNKYTKAIYTHNNSSEGLP